MVPPLLSIQGPTRQVQGLQGHLQDVQEQLQDHLEAPQRPSEAPQRPLRGPSEAPQKPFNGPSVTFRNVCFVQYSTTLVARLTHELKDAAIPMWASGSFDAS